MKVRVEIWESIAAMNEGTVRLMNDASVDVCDLAIRTYDMNHNDAAERRVLGEQCRNAFEAGQCVVTYPVGSK